MIPSKLRQVRFQFTLRHVCVCHSRCAGGSLSIRNRICASNSSSRLIYSTKAIDSLRPSGSVTAYSQLHSNGPVISLGKEYFSTEAGANAFKQKPDLFVNTAEILPEIYASPSAVLRERSPEIVPLESGCKSIFINKDGKDEQWHTATYYTKTGSKLRETFHSGKFGGFMGTPFSSEETCIVDGTVYYRSENVAKEAAAARALDCLAFRLKYSKLSVQFPGDDEPIRYCVELPHFELRSIHKNTHAPVYFWSCLMQAKYGPIDAKFELQSKHFESDNAGLEKGINETWYSASCLDPKTGESFHSGVFSLGIGKSSFMPDAPTTPLPLEEVRILDNRVYYRDELVAKHAAAARAIDCYYFRSFPGEDSSKKIKKLCLEEPYEYLQDKHPNNYEALAKIVAGRRRRDPQFSFSDFVKSLPDPSVRPSKILHDGLTRLRRTSARCKMFEWASFKDGDGHSWYNAWYTSALTKEKIHSGILRLPDDDVLLRPFHSADIQVVNGKVFYKEINLAAEAAAARAIDCYVHREENPNTSLCFEDPYKREEGESQVIDYETILAQREDRLQKMDRNNTRENAKHSTSSFISTVSPDLLKVPQNFLTSALMKHNRTSTFPRTESLYDIEEKRHGDNALYHATFTDPTTNEQFTSGLIRRPYVEKRTGGQLLMQLYLADVEVLDGKVYYESSELAENAAAARAIDNYIYREQKQNPGSIGNIKDIKLCLEEPYESAADRKSQQIDYEALLCKRDRNEELYASEIGIASEAKVNNDVSSMGGIAEIWAETASVDPSIGALTPLGANVNNNLSTIGRITEIWTETTTGVDPSIGALTSSGIEPPEEHRIAQILDWYRKVQHNQPRNHEEASALAQLCGKILSALGNANTGLHLNEKERQIRVEDDAKAILDKIILLSTTFDQENHRSFVNANTFKSYMRCFDRSDANTSATKAEELLKKMHEKQTFDSIELPQPNVGTFNAVMEWWSLVEGQEGQKGVNDVYSLLEAAPMSADNECPVRPNNETLKTLLAVNSKVDDCFSFEEAKLWLDKISRLSDSICSETLILDADVYYAALSLLPSKSDADSAGNTFANSWLKYGYQYKGGFKSDGSKAEAMDMAKWLLYAEECGVEPNVDMYEAVIRAWTNTGTKEGLLLAEEWAKRAVSSSSATRLDTFHPIIAAWSLCEFEGAPDRVQEWNKQLSLVCASKPHLKPDLDTLSAYVIAWKNVQAGMMARLVKNGESSSEANIVSYSDESGNGSRMLGDADKIFAAARNCKHFLEETFSGWSKSDDSIDFVADAMAFKTMFTHTIQAWGCASRFALLHPTSPVTLDTSRGIDEMLKIARLFDTKIDADESEQNVQHILPLLGRSYAEIASEIYQIDSALDPDEGTTCHFILKIAHIERMVRDYEFYYQKHFSQSSSFMSESKSVRHQLYEEVLRGCTCVRSPRDHGHVVRVCKLIMDHLSWQDEQCQNYGGGRVEEDITEIYVKIARLMENVVTSPHERMYVLTTIYNNAKPFFEQKKRFLANRYATVDRERLIGAMRMAMGDHESTETFLQKFEKLPPKKRARGNTAMSFVEEMLKKNR